MRIVLLMKILSEAKQGESHSLFSSAAGRINPADEKAFEAALRLKEQWKRMRGEEAEILILSRTEKSSAALLRRYLGMGASRIVLLQAGGADTRRACFDALNEGLSSVAPFDLLLAGERSADGGSGLVAPMLAEQWRLPFLRSVEAVEWDETEAAGEGVSVVATRSSAVAEEKIGARLPLMAGISERAPDLRMPHIGALLESLSDSSGGVEERVISPRAGAPSGTYCALAEAASDVLWIGGTSEEEAWELFFARLKQMGGLS